MGRIRALINKNKLEPVVEIQWFQTSCFQNLEKNLNKKLGKKYFVISL
jgi:hypothetical protein